MPGAYEPTRNSIAFEQFFCKCFIRLRANRGRRIGRDRESIGGRFGKADAARHNALEDLSREVILDFLHHIGGEIRARVEHGQDHAAHAQVREERGLDTLDRLGELSEAFQSEILTLYRDKHAIPGGDESIDRENAQRGGQSIRM